MKNQLLKAPVFLVALILLFSSCDQIFSEVKILEENEKGIEALNGGDAETSLVHFHNAIQLNPQDPETKATVYRNIALSHADLVNDDSAIFYHKKAAECYERGDYYYLLNMADADLYDDNVGGALSRLHQANALNPEDVGSNNSLGLIYLGEYDEEYYDLDKALKYNKKAYEVNKDRITEQVLTQTYIAMDDHDNAAVHLKSVYEEYPPILEEFLNIAELEIMLNADVDLDLTFQLIEELDPTKKEKIDELKRSLETP